MEAPPRVMVTVLVRPISKGRMTFWRVSCNECDIKSIPINGRGISEQIAYQHARDKHLGSARVVVRTRT